MTTLRNAVRLFALAAVLLGPSLAVAAPAEFLVQAYGAKGDGIAVDTAAIQKAIDAAAKAHGGTVVFKPGTYLTGSLFLKSGTNLRVDDGVTLLGVHDLSAYPIMQTRVAGIEMAWPAALINVYEQKDVTISGKGTIDGDGKFWWDSYRSLRAQYEPRGLRWASDYDAKRPRLIQIYKSSHVKVADLLLRRSGFWTVHICYSDEVTVDGVTIRNNEDGRGPSTDGIDIDSSTHILVQHADIIANDDALCLKAGRDSDGLRVNKPTEHVVIRDSTIRVGAAGVTFGSETSGGFHDIEVYGLHVLSGAGSGILFKSAHTRGGSSSDIRIHDIVMEGVRVAVQMTMNWNPSYSYAVLPAGISNMPPYWKTLVTPVPPEQGMPHFSNVHIWNIEATGARRAFDVSAYPQAPLTGFRFDHMEIEASTAGSIQDAKDWTFSDTRLQIADRSRVAVTSSQNVSGLPGTSPAPLPR